MDDGRKLFAWGGLPGELVEVQINKKKSKLWQGTVVRIIEASRERIEPRDPDSFLSTSPWQSMTFDAEQRYKAELINDAFSLHHVVLPNRTDVFTDNRQFEYRNKIEFSFWHDTDVNKVNLAFFRRGTHGKISTDHTSLAHPNINHAARTVVEALNLLGSEGRALKTLLVRSTQSGQVSWQLYVKDESFPAQKFISLISSQSAAWLASAAVIYSNPLSPASIVTRHLSSWSSDQNGQSVSLLSDTLCGKTFTYAVDGFFQINLPVYEQVLRDISGYVDASLPVVDLYSGVGTIGLSLDVEHVTLVELNPAAVLEMKQNIDRMGRQGSASAVLAASEKALDYISSNATIIVDPPRVGLHADVVERLLVKRPKRIIYLSCNPVTQARDYALLAGSYEISAHSGYNFFPRTPHIEHLIILDLK